MAPPPTKPPQAPPKGGKPAAMQDGKPKNLKELRKAFAEVRNSPDGMDPDPLTVPKCVECAHCGWPVFPREAKVATKKTYARAGIVRGPQKKAGTGVEDGDGEGEGEGDAGSADSRDTVERLEDKIVDLEDKVTDLERENKELKKENEELSTKLKLVEAQLEEAKEKIETLEEKVLLYREDLTQAGIERDRLISTLDRAWSISSDRETGLVRTLEKLRDLRETFAKWKVRRALMLEKLECRFRHRESIDFMAIAIRFWRYGAKRDRLLRKMEDIELRRQRQVGELALQRDIERSRANVLDVACVQFRGRLKAAGHRLLWRCLGSTSWPWVLSHALSAWVAAHPVHIVENVLKDTKEELEETQAQVLEQEMRGDSLQEQLNETTAERDKLLDEVRMLGMELEDLQKDTRALRHSQSKDVLEARQAQEKAKEEKMKRDIVNLEEKLKAQEAVFDGERETMDVVIKGLESRLALAEAAAAAGEGGGGGPREEDEVHRVVPKGQGVLCVGCLKQLLHRAVKPLPPVGALKDHPQKSEKAKRCFFQQELDGMASPTDAVHSYAWKARRDPYGVSKLTVFPTAAATAAKGGRLANPGTANQDSTWHHSSTPALPTVVSPTRKLAGLRGLGSASPLKMSMTDFRVKNFR